MAGPRAGDSVARWAAGWVALMAAQWAAMKAETKELRSAERRAASLVD